MSITKQFVVAGRAVFTVEPAESYIAYWASKGVVVKSHYTYRVEYKEANGKWAESWFIKLLSGPDNTSSYTYLGKLELPTHENEKLCPANLGVRLTPKSRFNATAQPVQIIRKVISRLHTDGKVEDVKGWKFHHEGSCGRCGRALTVPESIERGIGPECWGIMGGGKTNTPQNVIAQAEAIWLSDEPLFSIEGLTPQRNDEGEIEAWQGMRDNKFVTVFND